MPRGHTGSARTALSHSVICQCSASNFSFAVGMRISWLPQVSKGDWKIGQLCLLPG